jgi:hypothetical protein
MQVSFCDALTCIQTTNNQPVQVDILMVATLPRIVNLLVATPCATLLRVNQEVIGLVIINPVRGICVSFGNMPAVIKNAMPSLYWLPVSPLYSPDLAWGISPELKSIAAAAWGLPLTLDAADMSAAAAQRTAAFMAYKGAFEATCTLVVAHRRRKQRHLPCEVWLLMLMDYFDHPYLKGLRFRL